MRVFAVLFALLFALPAYADEAPELRTELVTIKHVQARDVVDILEAFLSRYGQLQANDRLNAITVSDQPALVEKMLEVIATVDVPAPELEITVFLVEAGSSGRTDPNLKKALSDVWDDLAGLFSYQGYTELDRGLLRVTAGNHASQAIGGDRDFTLNLRARQIDPSTGTFQLTVELTKRHLQPDGTTRSVRLVETTLEVKDGKTSVVGASRLNGDSGALITILQTTVIKGN